MVKVVLFDVDGVLCIPPELFSVRFARDNNIDIADLKSFFTGPFFQSTIGKADLKDLIREYNHIWKWDKSIDDLLDYWFASDHVVNEPVIAHVQKLRHAGIKCYTATNQEQYRAAYIRDKMFPSMFDGYFASCDLGVAKPSVEFFDAILQQLHNNNAITGPNEVAFFDDSRENVDAASSRGINAYYTDVRDDITKIDLVSI